MVVLLGDLRDLVGSFVWWFVWLFLYSNVGWKISFLFLSSKYIHYNSWIHLFPPTTTSKYCKTSYNIKSPYQHHAPWNFWLFYNNPHGGFVGWSSWSCKFCMMILYGDFIWWILYSNVGWKISFLFFFLQIHHYNI